MLGRFIRKAPKPAARPLKSHKQHERHRLATAPDGPTNRVPSRSAPSVGNDQVHDPHAPAAVGAVGEHSAPVGLEDGGEGRGHLSHLLRGQPEVGVGESRGVLPLAPAPRARSPGTPPPPPGCGPGTRGPRRPWRPPRPGWKRRGRTRGPRRPPARASPVRRCGRGALGEVVALQELQVIRRRARAQPGELRALGRRQLVPRRERVDDRHPGRMGERPDVPGILQTQRVRRAFGRSIVLDRQMLSEYCSIYAEHLARDAATLVIALVGRTVSTFGDGVALVALTLRLQADGAHPYEVASAAGRRGRPPAAARPPDRAPGRHPRLPAPPGRRAAWPRWRPRSRSSSCTRSCRSCRSSPCSAPPRRLTAATWSALIPRVVGEDHLAEAISAQQSLNVLALVAAPAVGGLLAGAFGIGRAGGPRRRHVRGGDRRRRPRPHPSGARAGARRRRAEPAPERIRHPPGRLGSSLPCSPAWPSSSSWSAWSTSCSCTWSARHSTPEASGTAWPRPPGWRAWWPDRSGRAASGPSVGRYAPRSPGQPSPAPGWPVSPSRRPW